MGLFNRDKEPKSHKEIESDETVEEDDEEEFDEVICPHCEQSIKSVVVKSLRNGDRPNSVEIIACPKCNKVLGALEY